MSEDSSKIVGKITLRVAKFDGELVEGREPVEVVEKEYPISRLEAELMGLIPGGKDGTDDSV